MAALHTEHPETGCGLWLQWVLASILGFAMGAAMGNPVAGSIPPMSCTQSSLDSLADRLTNFPCMLPVLTAAMFGAIFGVAGGFVQWLVLRRQLGRAGRWVLASTASFAIALAVAMNPPLILGGDSIATSLLVGVIFGVASGIRPRLVLRRQVARAGWWVPAHLLGSLMGGALGILTFHAVSAMGYDKFGWMERYWIVRLHTAGQSWLSESL